METIANENHRSAVTWDTTRRVRLIGKPVVFLVCLLPLAVAIARTGGLLGGLGANPVEALLHHFGEWGLRFVLIALTVTPLRIISGRNWLVRFRRMLGLFAFLYVLLHFLVYFALDQSLSLEFVLDDIIERPYITLGMTALTILTALAATSTNRMRRRLKRSWQKLHNGVYLVGVLGVWHYWWQVKKDITEPLVYAVILAALLGFRLWTRFHRRS